MGFKKERDCVCLGRTYLNIFIYVWTGLYLKPDVLKYTNEYTVKSKSLLLHPLSVFLTHPSRVSYCCWFAVYYSILIWD